MASGNDWDGWDLTVAEILFKRLEVPAGYARLAAMQSVLYRMPYLPPLLEAQRQRDLAAALTEELCIAFTITDAALEPGPRIILRTEILTVAAMLAAVPSTDDSSFAQGKTHALRDAVEMLELRAEVAADAGNDLLHPLIRIRQLPDPPKPVPMPTERQVRDCAAWMEADLRTERIGWSRGARQRLVRQVIEAMPQLADVKRAQVECAAQTQAFHDLSEEVAAAGSRPPTTPPEQRNYALGELRRLANRLEPPGSDQFGSTKVGGFAAGNRYAADLLRRHIETL